VDTANPLLLFALADAKDATTRRAPRDATVVLLPDRRVVVASAAALRVTADMFFNQSNTKRGEGRSVVRSFPERGRARATWCDADGFHRRGVQTFNGRGSFDESRFVVVRMKKRGNKREKISPRFLCVEPIESQTRKEKGAFFDCAQGALSMGTKGVPCL
jgi:hypothetical protein